VAFLDLDERMLKKKKKKNKNKKNKKNKNINKKKREDSVHALSRGKQILMGEKQVIGLEYEHAE
jgi:hypothetical protein